MHDVGGLLLRVHQAPLGSLTGNVQWNIVEAMQSCITAAFVVVSC